MAFWQRESLFGKDTDELFAYTTKKSVWIRDRWIGLFYYCMIFFVVLWVLFGQILFRNEQFLRKPVNGLPRMWVSHPTVAGCAPAQHGCKSDYRALEDLPYCDVSSPSLGETWMKAACKYEDRTSINPHGEVDNKFFIPTAVELITERRVCIPSEENGFTCDNEYEELPGTDCLLSDHEGDASMCKTRAGKKDQFYYVADIANFVIQFTSSYAEGSIHGTSLDHPGYVGVCTNSRRKPGSTRLWQDRTTQELCTTADLNISRMPCVSGVPCKREKGFVEGVAPMTERQIHDYLRSGRSRFKSILGHDGEEESTLAGEGSGEAGGGRDSDSASFIDVEVGRGRKLGWRQDGQRPFGRLRDAGHHRSQSSHSVRKPHHRAPRDTLHMAAERPVPEEASGEHQDIGVERQPDMYTSMWGDMFKVKKLLEIAGVDLDRDVNADLWTSRQSGTVIEVRAVYNNLHMFWSSFGYMEVEYHYEVTELPMPYTSRIQLAEVQPDNFPEERIYERRHGVLVWFKVAGTFGDFNIVYLLLMLVTASALISTASTVTDWVCLHLHPRKDNFFHLKYDVSPDFSDMWQCNECKFWNWEEVDRCQGIRAFKCPHTTPRCEAPRPGKDPNAEKHRVATVIVSDADDVDTTWAERVDGRYTVAGFESDRTARYAHASSAATIYFAEGVWKLRVGSSEWLYSSGSHGPNPPSGEWPHRHGGKHHAVVNVISREPWHAPR